MVLRGAQIQRCGPAGCGFLTRRALINNTARVSSSRGSLSCRPCQGKPPVAFPKFFQQLSAMVAVSHINRFVCLAQAIAWFVSLALTCSMQKGGRMSYRYNTLDIVVGVGMCAVAFGAMLFFVATSGTFLVAGPPPASAEQSSAVTGGMTWLQPALGQAIVERSLLQRRSDHITAAAMSEWKHAMQGHRSFKSIAGNPFRFVVERAVTIPTEHAARVQTVVGRSIVNFTRHGVRSGDLSVDQPMSDYNSGRIGVADTMRQRLDRKFESTWQPMLGRWIVDASQEYMRRVGTVQAQLGSAIVHVSQAKTGLEDAWEANRYQLASLMAASDRTSAMDDRMIALARADTRPGEVFTGSSAVAGWPEIPMGYLIAAVFGLCAVFFGGMMSSAASRESKALAEARRNAARWVYRLAA